MAKGQSSGMDYVEHERTYGLFIRLTAATIVAIAQILISLTAMTILGGAAFWVGLAGLVVGLVVIAATLASGLSWTASLIVLAATVVLSVLTL